jgi:uncharacterized protein (DUF2141 family)
LAYGQTYAIQLTIENINPVKGEIKVGIFNNKYSFLKENEEFKTIKIKVTQFTEKYTIKNLPKGEYAISIYHDKNSDNVCNLNFWGIPIEAYGFSNNCQPLLSAPSFKDCEIDLHSNISITIRLIY